MSISVYLPQPKWDRFILQRWLYSNVTTCPNKNNPWGMGVDNQPQRDLFGIPAACKAELLKTFLNKCGRRLRWQLKGDFRAPGLELAVTCCLLPAPIALCHSKPGGFAFWLTKAIAFPAEGTMRNENSDYPCQKQFQERCSKKEQVCRARNPKGRMCRGLLSAVQRVRLRLEQAPRAADCSQPRATVVKYLLHFRKYLVSL